LLILGAIGWREQKEKSTCAATYAIFPSHLKDLIIESLVKQVETNDTDSEVAVI
jgi:hypothetical protein